MACELLPAQARRTSVTKLFHEDNFTKYLNNPEKYVEYYFAYMCHALLGDMERSLREDENDRFGTSIYGQALRYGKFAVCAACVKLYFENENSLEKLNDHVDSVLEQWLGFEKYFTSLKTNSSYFRVYEDPETGITKQDLNFEGYYKGRSLNYDLGVCRTGLGTPILA